MRSLIISLLFFSFSLQAGIKMTIKNGAWSDPTVWGGKTTAALPSKTGDTIVVNNYISLDLMLNFTNTVLSVSGKGALCGNVALNLNDAPSILYNDGSINVTDLKITRGRPPLQTIVTTSINNGSITYSNTFSTPGLFLWTYLEGNIPIQNRYTCVDIPVTIFATNIVSTCHKTCASFEVPQDIIRSDVQYSWVITDTEDHTTSGTQSSELCYTENTIITVKLITNTNSVIDTLLKEVNIFIDQENFIKISNDTAICENQKIQLTSLHNSVSVVWWHPNNRLSCDNCDSPVFTPKKGDRDISIIAYAASGSCRSYDTVNIKVNSNEKNFLKDTSICKEGMLFISGLYDATNIIWNDGSTAPSINISQSGYYWATITNQCGTRTDSAYVKYTDPKVYTIPNVFTPNNDGVNDNFEIKGIETYDQAKLTVFNRWGTRIFQSTDPFAAKWDGAKETDGIYFYNLETTDCNNGKLKSHGIIELVR